MPAASTHHQQNSKGTRCTHRAQRNFHHLRLNHPSRQPLWVPTYYAGLLSELDANPCRPVTRRQLSRNLRQHRQANHRLRQKHRPRQAKKHLPLPRLEHIGEHPAQKRKQKRQRPQPRRRHHLRRHQRKQQQPPSPAEPYCQSSGSAARPAYSTSATPRRHHNRPIRHVARRTAAPHPARTRTAPRPR